MARPIDVEGRRAVHAAAHAAHEVLVDASCVEVLNQLSVEHVEIELELSRQRWIAWTVGGIVGGILLILKLGTVGEGTFNAERTGSELAAAVR